MATATALMSIEDYLRTSYKPDADFIDGEIEERNMGEREHSTLESAIAATFWNNRKQWSIMPLTEQRIRVSQCKVRVADISIVKANAPFEKVTLTPPLICIEILSPEDRMARAKQVLADYWAMGVENIWLIDPIYRAAFTFNASGLHDADPTNLTVPSTPIHLDLTEAFAALDEA
jgi:Uma2 family endonuclease